jgi:hypothetical protein
MIDEVVASYVAGETSDGYPEEWDLDKLWRAFKQLYPISLRTDAVIEEAGGDKSELTADLITEVVREDAQTTYDRREQELTPELMREFERRVVLSVLDRKWREHLYEMDYLREGIGLRAMAQRDPLVEYQREGYDMFGAMMDGIKEESVGNLFNLQVEVQENPIVEEVTDGAPAVMLGTGALAAEAAPGAPRLAGPVPPGVVPPGAMPPGVVPAGAVPPGIPAAAAPPAAFGRPSAGSRAPAQGGGGGATAADSDQDQGGGRQGGARQGGARQAGSRQGGARPGGGRQGGKHANDGRGHATAAGRGQTATNSGGGAHAAPAGTAPAGTAPAGTEPVARGLEPNRPRQLQYSAPSEGGGVEHRRGSSVDPFANVGRNDLCPCGSGRKYKRCHGDPRNA